MIVLFWRYSTIVVRVQRYCSMMVLRFGMQDDGTHFAVVLYGGIRLAVLQYGDPFSKVLQYCGIVLAILQCSSN